MHFVVNGIDRTFLGDQELSLLDYLEGQPDIVVTREPCHGADRCGACSVILDGRPVLACRVPMGKVAGRVILTADERQQALQDALARALVQQGPPECPFCVAETIIRARNYLMDHPNPDFDEAYRATSHYLCRCMGRKKIARAMLDALETLAGAEMNQTCALK